MVTPFFKNLSPGLLGGLPPGFYPYPINQSCRFNRNQSAYLTRTPGGADANLKEWIFSTWVKRCELSTNNLYLFSAGTNDDNRTVLYFNSSDQLSFLYKDATVTKGLIVTDMKFRDVTNWYHILVTVDSSQATAADRYNVYVNGTLVDCTYTTNITLNDVFDVGATQAHYIGENAGATSTFDGYMAETRVQVGVSVQQGDNAITDYGAFKYGVWRPINITGLSYGTNGFYFKYDNKAEPDYTNIESTLALNGWFNNVANPYETLTLDDGFNGVTLVNSVGSGYALASDDAGASAYNFGATTEGQLYKFSCTVTVNSGSLDKDDLQAVIVDGSLNISSQRVDLVAGANTCYLMIDTARASGYMALQANATDVDVSLTNCNLERMDSDGFGWDSSGLTNHFGSVDFLATNDNRFENTSGTPELGDQMLDSPTNNYPTLNSLDTDNTGLATVFRQGNLDFIGRGTGEQLTRCTMALPTSGKWYWEVVDQDFASNKHIGVKSDYGDIVTAARLGDGNGEVAFRTNSGGDIFNEGAETQSNIGTTTADYDVIGVLFNADDGEISFYINGSIVGVAETLPTLEGNGVWVPAISTETNVAADMTINFGQHPFYQTVPTGYKKLCTDNLVKPTILTPTDGFNILTWTGDGSNPRSLTGLNFQPDLVWLKSRNLTENNLLGDSVRGFAAANQIFSDSTAAQGNNSAGEITAATSDGFTVDVGSVSDNAVNDSSDTYVSWCWKEDPKFGFDIVTYEGTGVAQNIAHNLGAAPELIIVKGIDAVRSWRVYHHHALTKTDPETDMGVLHDSDAWSDTNSIWDDTAPDASNFRIGTATSVNANGETYIAYLFRSIAGYSKIFSYEGNANADGPFVHCGFRPAFVLLKNADRIADWKILDSIRNTYNPVEKNLEPNTTAVEGSNDLDFLSNGFKITHNSNTYNANNETHIGIAFAALPGKWSNAF